MTIEASPTRPITGVSVNFIIGDNRPLFLSTSRQDSVVWTSQNPRPVSHGLTSIATKLLLQLRGLPGVTYIGFSREGNRVTVTVSGEITLDQASRGVVTKLRRVVGHETTIQRVDN